MAKDIKKRLLVTGSSGLVGSACFDLFTKKGWEVLGIDNGMRQYFFNLEKYDVVNKVDIRDEDLINELFQQFKPDAIIHAAAQPSHDWAKNEPITDFEVNATGTLILLEAMRKYAPEATFVHVSTDKVYGENMCAPHFARRLEEQDTRYSPTKNGVFAHMNGFTEDLGLDFAGHRSLFGCSKLAADVYAQEYADMGFKVGIFRPGCITGSKHAGAEYHGFLAYLTKCIKEGKTYKIFGYKGKQVRDQIHADDLATAFMAYIEKPKKGGVYNIGGGIDRSVSVLEAGEMISKKLDKPFLYELHEQREGDRQWDVHDISKFRKDYPKWDYKYTLSDIIDDLCKTK